MSDVQVIKNTSNNLKNSSDHKLASSKTKNLSNQQNVDSNQNEINPDISNLKLKSTEKVASKTNERGELQTIRKCLRKGSRICYTDMENITVLRKIPERDGSKISFGEDEGFQKVDSYRSGESLFKTFTFEQTREIDDPETVKCIEFWKSVMKKNLAPIKCTLLENNKKPTEKKKEKSSIPEEKINEPRKSEEKAKNSGFPGDGAKIWSEALREIREKKLDQLKLYVRERCQYCTDPFTREIREKMGTETAGEQQSEILSLNEWKPKNEQIDLMDNTSKPSLRRRYSIKTKKMSQSQTVETRMNEKSASDPAQKDQQPAGPSKTRITIPDEATLAADAKQALSDRQEPAKRPPSILKVSSRLSQRRSSVATEQGSKKMSTPAMSSVEVQAPSVKCPCESDTCVCPHRSAARNSRTSFVEIARKNMLHQDASTEKFFPKAGEACICERYKPEPWLKLNCLNEPCPAKNTKVDVEESNSDFNMNTIVHIDETSCICNKSFDVVCPSINCKNKISQGSLIEGYPKDRKDPCVCSEEYEVPCKSDVCPTKTAKEAPTTCICGLNLPWARATCQSWKCPHHRSFKIKRTEDEEKITFRGHPHIKNITSSCMCEDEIAWESVTCECDICMGRPKPDSNLKIKEKKHSVLRTNLKSRTNSREGLVKKNRSKEKVGSSTSLVKAAKEKERAKPKTTDKPNKCVCSGTPPWKLVKCTKKCTNKDWDKNKSNLSSVSVDRISVPKDEECVCKDPDIEPICKSHKCKNQEVNVEYPPPCICPKDLEDGKHAFRCTSETCKMRKLDKTCLCRLQPDSPCDAKTCVYKPRPSKSLVQTKRQLRYDPKCVCKVRGLPTTQEVACVAPECPFKKKYPKIVKKKIPKIFLQPPREYKSSSEETVTKCVCNTKNAAGNVKCRNVTCKRKDRSDQSDQSGDFDDEDNSEQEVCICKSQRTEEVICNAIQCPRTSVGEDGTVMNDKCVCANLDQPCAEPNCPSAGNENHHQHQTCYGIEHKMERSYCYICGRRDCAGARKRTKMCEEVFDDTKYL